VPCALTALVFALALGGCATPGPDHIQLNTVSAKQVGLGVQQSTDVSVQWWRELGDETLNNLIGAALKDRPTMQIAKSRVYKAMALTELSESASMPQLGLGLDRNRQSYSTNGLFGGLLQQERLQTTTSSTFQAGLNWNIDLWGMHAAQTAAAIGETKALEADLATAALLTAAQVTQGYISLAKMGTQLDVAERAMEQRQEIYNLTKSRLQVGLDTKVEVSQAQSFYYEARVQREIVLEQMELIRHQLAALTEQPMSALDKVSPRLDQLKFSEIPVVVGADLLGRRPDIVAARWRVEAATHDVSAARKQFYPNINLNAYAGYNALKSNPLINGNSKQFGVDPAITLPIFDGGRLRSQLGSKRAELDAAIAQYNETITQAARESSDVLSSTQSILKQRTEQQEALQSARTAYELSLERYKAGLGNYLIVLNTESQWLSQQRLFVDLQARQLDTRVALVRALGGGFSAGATQAPKQDKKAEDVAPKISTHQVNQDAPLMTLEKQESKDAADEGDKLYARVDADTSEPVDNVLLSSNK
jgi:NodT family efflux transporter outer membrane factor (OMF) lipoprotein